MAKYDIATDWAERSGSEWNNFQIFKFSNKKITKYNGKI